MEVRSILNKRWVGFFALFFIVWYPGSLILVTVYQVTTHPLLFIAGNVFTPLWALLVSYLYFRKARNDWTARFVTAFGWMILMFFFSVLLVGPVYGATWQSILNLNTINVNWINLVAILVGGLAAHRSPTTV
ncbi:hypothetical protein COV05_04130 [Candidatus Uhrbacteria bacterium CG10_big_fil_rev_8_21_14_0_10_48_16]|uniref:Uncharacterized protein n=1 Tax=Candidatus Uhrbacteria bacterium CG10_big_fil_rev_8_21_14_0_10_48_16 TaxID=1975038 RepID=A0A2M8LGF7_9BACT|nr:MAG: hypothetical protein COV05_04130 [Candidatus Uhrbacteria bacterium CG10_big_fil_rev_8_21_14_0_10_48_16]